MLRKLRGILTRTLTLDRVLDRVLINQGVMMRELQRRNHSTNLRDYEFKVFSQWGEDGIIQHLTENLQVRNRTFIEFGVGDFRESNCRYLLMQSNWSGMVIDGSQRNIQAIQSSYYFWQHRLQAVCAFIDRDNIHGLLTKSGFDRELGILSVDIDGVDYYVLEALDQWTPSILIVEYNGLFGPTAPVTVPYDSAFQRTKAHYSNVYWGASLGAFCHLADKRGYALVGTNSVGSNAFFVRRDLLNERVQEVSATSDYAPTTFRESRDSSGALTFLDEKQRQSLVSQLPVVDVVSGQTKTVGEALA